VPFTLIVAVPVDAELSGGETVADAAMTLPHVTDATVVSNSVVDADADVARPSVLPASNTAAPRNVNLFRSKIFPSQGGQRLCLAFPHTAKNVPL
jgi:hypothetical protein